MRQTSHLFIGSASYLIDLKIKRQLRLEYYLFLDRKLQSYKVLYSSKFVHFSHRGMDDGPQEECLLMTIKVDLHTQMHFSGV